MKEERAWKSIKTNVLVMDFRITATPHLGKPIKGVHAVPDR
jgi:hypothetical protein